MDRRRRPLRGTQRNRERERDGGVRGNADTVVAYDLVRTYASVRELRTNTQREPLVREIAVRPVHIRAHPRSNAVLARQNVSTLGAACSPQSRATSPLDKGRSKHERTETLARMGGRGRFLWERGGGPRWMGASLRGCPAAPREEKRGDAPLEGMKEKLRRVCLAERGKTRLGS